MNCAYVDTSCLVAVAFGEAKSVGVRRRLEACDRLYSSNLLEAELHAALIREGVPWEPALVESVGWVLPARRLTTEISRALAAGYLRGADLWHVACALHLAAQLGALDFISLDEPQRMVAAAAGLNAPRV